MEKEIFSIELSNGTKIEKLELNGNNFISDTEITAEMFEGGLLEVRISGDKGTVYTINHAKLIQIMELDGKWWFILAEMSAEELMFEKISSNIDYIAMMTDVEIEGDEDEGE